MYPSQTHPGLMTTCRTTSTNHHSTPSVRARHRFATPPTKSSRAAIRRIAKLCQTCHGLLGMLLLNRVGATNVSIGWVARIPSIVYVWQDCGVDLGARQIGLSSPEHTVVIVVMRIRWPQDVCTVVLAAWIERTRIDDAKSCHRHIAWTVRERNTPWLVHALDQRHRGSDVRS